MITYTPNFILSFSGCNGKKKLPQSAVKALYTTSKIKKTMNDATKEKYEQKIDSFNEEEMKKQLNLLLNKLSKDNLEMISQKINTILQKRVVLIEYCIIKILEKSIRMHLFIEVYVQLFVNITNDYTKKIFKKIFNKLFETLNKKSIDNTNKTYDDFCNYLKDKDMLIGLYIFLANIYNKKIFSYDMLKDKIYYLENNMLISNKEDNNLYGEVYTKFFKSLEDKKIIKKHISKLNEIKTTAELNMRTKFMLMDIEDLLK